MLASVWVWLIVTYVAASAATLFSTGRGSARARSLLVPAALNFLASAGTLVLLVNRPPLLRVINPFGSSREEIFVVGLLGTIFAITLEVPGFLLNTSYDKKVSKILNDFERAVVQAHIDPGSAIHELRSLTDSHRDALADAGLEMLFSQSLEVFERMNNSDASLLRALLTQVSDAKSEVEARSKHPFPLLVQVLGLSGLAFVLGEILAILRQG